MLGTDTITVIEPTWTEDRGTPVPDYDDPASTVQVKGCSVQPGASDEGTAGRQNVTVRHTVYAPPGIAVTAHSAVLWKGVRYAVDGEPLRWSGRLAHTVIYLVDWRG